jgi:D-threonate/D-erythronate kinase
MITVIADDLTGAAEIAGICLRYGIEVSFGIDTIPEKLALVTIIATDSRSMKEKDAYQTHRKLAASILEKNKKTILFKKCDSALRGHILTEMVALFDVTSKTTALLQPANPNANRFIKNGYYLINDVLIENTGFAVDPDFPSTSSSVKKLLFERTTKLSNSDRLFIGTINEIQSEGIYIPDADSETDLILDVNLYQNQFILGGSAAFFEQFLLRQFPNVSKKNTEELHFLGNYVLVSGSTQPESIQFAKSLQEQDCPLIAFPELLLKKDIDHSLLNDWIKKSIQIFDKNQKLCLRISEKIIQFEDSSTILKNRLSDVVEKILEQTSIDELFIEGGATAYDILQKLEWKSFTPIAELSLGVVRMQYDENPKKHITIKPGSYKWPKELLL